VPDLTFALVLALCFPATARADYKDDIGYIDLVAWAAENNITLPTGASVSLAMAEAGANSNPPSSYRPDVPGVNIVDKSGGTGTSGHATTVANIFFGNNSILTGVTTADSHEANAWLTRILYRAYASSPAGKAQYAETADVVNHSWVAAWGSGANQLTPDEARALNALVDYSIYQDRYVAVVGVNNGYNTDQTAASHAPLLSSAYNVISVGMTNGNHDNGVSDLTGVPYPHIVAPATATSYATPMVSAAVALLIETARTGGTGGTAISGNGDLPEVVKTILLAGATKTEFANWSAGVTETAPLNARYGAGELNVFKSYLIMTGGEQTARTSAAFALANPVVDTGWDYATTNKNSGGIKNFFYSFTVAENMQADVSIALTWNVDYAITVTPTGQGDANIAYQLATPLADFSLYFYRVEENDTLTLIAQSLATGGNIEYLWETGLFSGDYLIQTSTGSANASYALAWQTTLTPLLVSVPVPEPETLALFIALVALFLSIARNFWRRA
jgi:hypothetical protein